MKSSEPWLNKSQSEKMEEKWRKKPAALAVILLLRMKPKFVAGMSLSGINVIIKFDEYIYKSHRDRELSVKCDKPMRRWRALYNRTTWYSINANWKPTQDCR